MAEYTRTPVILALESWRWEDPWGLAANQAGSSRLSETSQPQNK